MCEKFIPLSVPNLKGNELKYVTDAIESEWVSTAGKYVNDFEQGIAKFVKAEGAVSCQNGTSGIHIALLINGVNAKDEVLVPTLTFIAAVNPVKYIGAEPVFMDCDDSLCMDPVKLKDFCENCCDYEDGVLRNRNTKRVVKAVIIVHVFGNMADMDAIMEIAGHYGLKVIEDATEALGTVYTEGKYKGKYAGTIGDAGIYSFNGNKIMTTGGGGMMVAAKETDLQHAKHLTTQAKSDELYYTHDEIGYNYRMTNLQAALGLAQLEQLEEFISVKTRNYQDYLDGINKTAGLKLLKVRDGIRSNYWFYGLFCEEGYQLGRDELIQYLAEKKIQTRPIWGLIHEQVPYQDCEAYKIEKAVYYRDHVVNLPCSTNLTRKEVDRVLDELRRH